MDVPKGNAQGPFAKLAALRDALPAGAVPAPAKPGGDAKQARRGTIATILDRRAGVKQVASTGSEPTRARSDADEAAVFLSEMAGVSRLGAPTRARVERAATPPRTKVTTDDAEVLAELADLCDAGERAAFDWADTDEHGGGSRGLAEGGVEGPQIAGIAEGLDRRLLKRLRAGDFAIQAHVDLHGLTRVEAKDRVARFVDDSRRAGHRTVLVVHGRGLHSKDHVPVLKQALAQWLERGPLARAVLAFTTARPADGGAGALLLLLRGGRPAGPR